MLIRIQCGLLILAFVFTTGILDSVYAQTTGSGTTYQRKSISYIPAVYLPKGEAYKMKSHEMEYLIREVRDAIEMDRFDFNQLPEEITEEYLEQADDMGSLNLDEVETLLEETVVPAILKILDAEKELRAANLVTVEQRQRFITTRARELGITAAQLEQVMNSAYLYFPFVEEVDLQEDDGMYTCSIDGGIIWYHVIPDAEDPKVELLRKEATGTFGTGKEGKRYAYAGKSLSGGEFALYTAVGSFARNLMVITQSIPDFMLRGEIRYVKGSRVEFNLGRKEGVKVDDGFYVQEQVQTAEGGVDHRRVGFVRTVDVGDNHEGEFVHSRGALVLGRGISRGMQTREHPRLPIDLVVKLRMHALTISPGIVGVEWLDGAEILEAEFREEYNGVTAGIDLDANYHFGRHLGIPLFLLSIGGTYTPVPSEIYVRSYQDAGWEETTPYLLQVRGGFVKKYFYRRLGLSLGGQFGWTSMRAGKTVLDLDGEDHTLSLSNNTLGGTLQAGIELVITPDFFIGGYYGIQLYPESTAWSFSVDHDSYPVLSPYESLAPQFDATSPVFGVYFHYQPPALPFDPWSLFRGSAGL